HARFSRDWSSDVCSSDLGAYHELGGVKPNPQPGDDSDGGIGGAVGTMFRDDGFAIDVDGGGSGGGGGSAFNDVSDPVEIPNHSKIGRASCREIRHVKGVQ